MSSMESNPFWAEAWCTVNNKVKAIEVIKGSTDNGFTAINLPVGFDLLNVKVVVKGAYSILSAWKNAGEMAC